MNSRENNQADSDRCGMCGKSRHKLSLMGHILLPLRAAGDSLTEIILNMLARRGITVDATLRKQVSQEINASGVPSICSVCIQSWAKEFLKDARIVKQQASLDDNNFDPDAYRDAVPSTHPDYTEKPLTPAEERGFRELMKTLNRPGAEEAK